MTARWSLTSRPGSQPMTLNLFGARSAGTDIGPSLDVTCELDKENARALCVSLMSAFLPDNHDELVELLREAERRAKR